MIIRPEIYYSVRVCVLFQNCIRDITDALISLCEDREENKDTSMMSNSQIIHSVIDIFGAGETQEVDDQ